MSYEPFLNAFPVLLVERPSTTCFNGDVSLFDVLIKSFIKHSLDLAHGTYSQS